MLGLAAVGVALLTYVDEFHNRTKTRHSSAWQVINSAQGQTGSGGRIQALEELSADHVPLDGVNVSFAWLQKLRLPRAQLRGAFFVASELDSASFRQAVLFAARFDHASLIKADFSDAFLATASFVRANMTEADFQRSYLSRAVLDSAILRRAMLQDADLVGAHLRGSDLWGADLRRAKLGDTSDVVVRSLAGSTHLEGSILWNARLDSTDVLGAHFDSVQFSGASLRGLRNWRSIASLHGANIYGIVDAPYGFVRWALDTMGAVAVRTNFDAVRERLGPGYYILTVPGNAVSQLKLPADPSFRVDISPGD